ncbi:hypothetical protein A0J61_07106 [Choanephora cucurbitarum]|uniref:Dienelactone hydrolase domain-containing protein n=1 Tax=Choanephora cucurbitarum TaxID=101091 RepID=A0A1C7N864_9FUNG|nr:hypothetical protein A0J61_07106 [Choanephora cucurbitarum]
MSYSKACCKLPSVESNYSPVGTIETVDDLKVYTVGPKDAKKAVVVVYDIFGLHPNTKQFCDILAKNCGWKVVMPDFLRGDYWSFERGGMDALVAWIEKVGSIENVTPDVNRVQEQLKKDGVEAATLVGFCWGAKISVHLTSTHPFFVGASLIHPSFVDVKDAEAAQAPILALPSKDEPDMTEYMEVLSKKPFASLCKHVRFDDQPHGFCAARGNFEDETNVKRATEAIQLTVDFFHQCFNQKQ